MSGTNADTSHSVLEKAFSELVRQAVRAEIQEIVRLIREEDRLLTIDQVAQDCLFRGIASIAMGKDWALRENSGPKMVHFSESGRQKWLKANER